MRSKAIDTTDWLPPKREVKKKISKDDEPGMPSIHSVKADNIPRTPKPGALPQMTENTISQSLGQKIDSALGFDILHDEEVDNILEDMASLVSSQTNFDSKEAFENYLTEGVLLNINRMVSNYIGVPEGEYIIYDIDPNNKSILIPTAEVTVQETDFTINPTSYEVYTTQLLGCWDKAERIISEDDADERDESAWRKSLPGGVYSKKERVQSSQSKYPRATQVKGAIEASGKDQDDIADACGVHPSSVSRWTAKSGKGSRLPDVKHAICMSKQTGQDVESMFGQSEGPSNRTKTRHKTSGSGGGRNTTYRQGS